MNGLSRNKLKIAIGLYLFFVVILVGGVLIYPRFYNAVQENNYEKLMDQITVVLNNQENPEKQLDKLVGEGTELVVLSDGEIIYETIPVESGGEISQFIKKENLSFQRTFKVGEQYRVWLAIYPTNIQTQFSTLSFFISLTLFLVFVALAIILVLLYRAFVNPLSRLRTSISHLKQFDFEKAIILTAYQENQGIITDISSFSQELKSNLDDIGDKYTTLALQLQEEHDTSEYRGKMINSLIHDLKTPISIMIMSVELRLEEEILSNEVRQNLEFLDNQLKKTLADVNRILKLANQKQDFMIEESVDMVVIIRETIKRFQSLIGNKKLFGEIDLPQTLVVGMSKVEAEQLMHNILSNVVSYTPQQGFFSLHLDEVDKKVSLSVYNDAEQVDEINFPHVFDLFYAKKEAEYSSGLGMYTIATIVKKYNGEYSFKPENEGVVLEVTLDV